MSQAVFSTYLAFPAGLLGVAMGIMGLWRPSRLAVWNALWGGINLALALPHIRWEWLF